MKLLKSRDLLAIVGIIAFSFFAVKPLLAPGFFSMHDDTQIARVFTMSEALKDGQFPVRVVEHLGYDYGYMIFNFYAPLSYYVGGFFVLLGFSSVIATKIMIGLGIVVAGIFMYLLAKEFWGKIGGVIAGIFYVYAPYHSVNVYVRGAIGELWAYGFIPLVFYGYYKLFFVLKDEYSLAYHRSKIKDQKSKIWMYITITAVGYAGIILSHNLTAMMVTPFLLLLFIVYCILFIKRGQLFAIRYLLYAFFLGLGLSSFYFLPALLEMKFADVGSVLGGGSDFRDHFLCPIQFWYSPWGYGGSVPGCLDGISFQLGKPHILFVLMLVPLLPLLFLKKRTLFYKVSLIFLCLGGVLFLMLPWSQFIWEFLRPMEYFQFPWRFLVLASFFMSLLAGGIITVGELDLVKRAGGNNLASVILGICLVTILGFYGKFFVPQFIVDNLEDQTNPAVVRFEVSKISDEYLPQGIPQPQSSQDVPQDKLLILGGQARLTQIKKSSNTFVAKGEVNSPTVALFQTAAFPAWKLYLNGQEHTYKIEDGKIKAELPPGEVELVLRFEQTTVEKVANSISLISLLALFAGIIITRRMRYHA